MNSTINYYNENAKQFASSTVDVEFTQTQDAFLQLLQPGALILDFGCGSGRDAKYFMEQGFRVEAVDGSEKMCALAAQYTGLDVRQMFFQDLDETDRYDGIWACSSILHLNMQELTNVFSRILTAMKTQGILYTSFKYGDFEGERDGRYFTNMDEEKSSVFLKQFPYLKMIRQWVTSDVRPGRSDEKWLNMLLEKGDGR